MAKKKVLKITPVLITLNVFILLLIVGFYTFRLVKYYKLEHTNTKEEIKFVDRVIQTQSYLDLTKGLILDKDSNTYTFKGDSTNNYVFYSGYLFRILSIDTNKNIKMVSEDVLTLMYSGLEKGYNSSYINKWLNKTDDANSGIFEKTLYNSDTYLVNTNLCMDNIDDLNNITCNDTNSDNKITLLSLDDYKKSGGINSFLNNKTSFYLSSINSSNENYYVNEDGNIGTSPLTTNVHGVRPVITINSKTLLISGNGSKDNPYKFETHEVATLKDAYVGSIINIDNVNYKITNKLDGYVKLVSNDVYKYNDENVDVYFDNTNNIYSTSNVLNKYLNTTYIERLSFKDKIVSAQWYVGKLTLDSLDYTNTYKTKTNSKIGLLTLGDLFINDVNNVFTMSSGIEDNNIINVINSNGKVYGDLITNKYNVRPSFYLKDDISVVSGIGTLQGPYELGGLNE